MSLTKLNFASGTRSHHESKRLSTPFLHRSIRNSQTKGDYLTDRQREISNNDHMPLKRTIVLKNRIYDKEDVVDLPPAEVFQSNKEYQRNYLQYLEKNRHFRKIKGQNTIFCQIINQNRKLLRRKQNDAPIDFEFNQKSNNLEKSIEIHKIKINRNKLSTLVTQKQNKSQNIARKIKQGQHNQKKENKFHKTIKNHIISFRKLCKTSQKTESDLCDLKNSLNRLIIAENIDLKLKRQIIQHFSPQSISRL